MLQKSLLIRCGLPIVVGLGSGIFLGVFWGVVVGTLTGVLTNGLLKDFGIAFFYLICLVCFLGYSGVLKHLSSIQYHIPPFGWSGVVIAMSMLALICGIIGIFVILSLWTGEFSNLLKQEPVNWGVILYLPLTALTFFLGYKGYLPSTLRLLLLGNGILDTIEIWSLVTGVLVMLFLLVSGLRESFAVIFPDVQWSDEHKKALDARYTSSIALLPNIAPFHEVNIHNRTQMQKWAKQVDQDIATIDIKQVGQNAHMINKALLAGSVMALFVHVGVPEGESKELSLKICEHMRNGSEFAEFIGTFWDNHITHEPKHKKTPEDLATDAAQKAVGMYIKKHRHK